MSKQNEWSQPVQPPPPLFLGEKERNLVKQVNDELIEKVINEKMKIESPRYHQLYNQVLIMPSCEIIDF